MAFLTVSKCLCLSLHTAGIVIGVVLALGSFIPIMLCFAELTRFHHYEIDNYDDGEYDGHIRKPNNNFTYFILAVSIAYLAACILLVVGTIKKSHFMLLPSLIINVAVLVLCIPFMLAFYYFAGVRGTLKERIQIFGVYSLIFGIFSYLWLVVYSLFEKIRAKNNEVIVPENQKNLIYMPPSYQVVQYNV